MPDSPLESPRPRRPGNPAWRADGYAMTTSTQVQGEDQSPGASIGRMVGVFDRIRTGTFLLDGDGVIREWREDAWELFARERDVTVGLHVEVLFAEADRPRAADMVATVLAGDDIGQVFEAVRGDGASISLDLRLVGIRDGAGHVMMLGYATATDDLRHVAYERAVLESVFQLFPVGVVVFDAEGRFLRLNDALARINGLPAAAHVGKRILEVLPGLDPRLQEIPDEVLRTGEPVVDVQYGGYTFASEDERVWSVSYNRLHDGEGGILGLSGMILDVTERHRSNVDARRIRERLALVNKAGERMGTALDVERTVQELAGAAVPDFADVIVVAIKEEVFDERIGPVGPAWLDPVRRRRVLVHVRDTGAVPAIVQARGVSQYSSYGELHDSLLSGHARLIVPDFGPDGMVDVDGRVLLAPPEEAGIMAPLLAREALLGIVYFFRDPGRTAFEQGDVDVAEEITARAAVSVDNARLYDRERSTALMLQRALLPQEIPALPGVEVAFRYLPGSVGAEVGGDWFDVIQLSGARVALVVGDVMGIGVRAAGIMGQFRTAARTLAGLDLTPAQVLHQLDELGASLSENHLATCIYAVYDPATGKLAVSRAGHPPPLLLGPDGSVGGLDVPASPPLGVGGGAYRSWVFETKEFDIADGSRLAFYTDGMVEKRGRDIDEGIGHLAALLANCPLRGSLEDCCDAVIEVLGITGDTADDATLLLAQVMSIPADEKAHWQLDAHPAAVAHARRLVREKLDEWGMAGLSDTAELLVSELVTNAQRYGHSPVELDLLKTDRLLVEVGDGLDVVPQVRRARDTDEGGRGLQLVNQLASRWGTRATPVGKIVWFELPPVASSQ